jgi:ligand-binding sensor protein
MRGEEKMKNKALVFKNGNDIEWKAFEEELHAKFGVNAVTFYRNGTRRTHDDVGIANDICCLVRKHPKGHGQICAAIQRFLNNEARVKKQCVAEECAAGMYKMVVPVIRKDEVDGFISTCGRPFLTSNRVYADFIQRTIGADEEKIQSLLPALDPIGPRTIKSMLNFITNYA